MVQRLLGRASRPPPVLGGRLSPTVRRVVTFDFLIRTTARGVGLARAPRKNPGTVRFGRHAEQTDESGLRGLQTATAAVERDSRRARAMIRNPGFARHAAEASRLAAALYEE